MRNVARSERPSGPFPRCPGYFRQSANANPLVVSPSGYGHDDRGVSANSNGRLAAVPGIPAPSTVITRLLKPPICTRIAAAPSVNAPFCSVIATAVSTRGLGFRTPLPANTCLVTYIDPGVAAPSTTFDVHQWTSNANVLGIAHPPGSAIFSRITLAYAVETPLKPIATTTSTRLS